LSWSIVVYEFRVSCLIQGVIQLCVVNTHTHNQGKLSARVSLKKERKSRACEGEKGRKKKWKMYKERGENELVPLITHPPQGNLRKCVFIQSEIIQLNNI
jgi:hypothetical protein